MKYRIKRIRKGDFVAVRSWCSGPALWIYHTGHRRISVARTIGAAVRALRMSVLLYG